MVNLSDGDILRPRVIIVPVESKCPTVSGASVKGMLNISGSKLYFVSDTIGTWTSTT